MTKEVSRDSVSLDPSTSLRVNGERSRTIDKERMLKYKAFAVAFSYPDDEFLKFFPKRSSEKAKLIGLYDHLFRLNEIWLYTAEYTAENEFERAKALADIMGFYRAFKVEPSKDRPDALAAEFEFMHYLIFKGIHAAEKGLPRAAEKAAVCLDAESKFFEAHLYPGAKKMADKISSRTKDNFYAESALSLVDFLESERKYFMVWNFKDKFQPLKIAKKLSCESDFLEERSA